MNAQNCISWTVRVGVAAACLSLLACSGGKTVRLGTGIGTNGKPGGAAPPALPEYRIGLLDQLEIKFYFHERFNETATVRPDGRITLQLIGDIVVAGMTPSELDRLVTEAYSQTIESPEVTVFVRGFGGLAVYVFGQVDRPGMFDLKPGMTVLQAVAAAGGPVRGASMSSVMVLRKDAAGELTASRVDLNHSAIKDAAVDDLSLYPRDIVYVPRTFIANVNEFLNQVYDGIFPPADIYLRALREYNRDNR